MRRTLLGFALSLVGLTPVPAAAQGAGPELRGLVFSVEDGQADRKYLRHVVVTLVEFKVKAETDDQGYFRARLPAGALAGQDVTLQEDQPDYYILFPVLSRLRVPAPPPPGKPEPVVEVWMAPKGSKVLLGPNFIEQFIRYTADDSAKKPKDSKGGAPDLSSYVSELAKQAGRPPEEILGQISRWVAEAKESDDPRKLGLAAFAEKKFRLAAENFSRAADAEKRRGAEGFRQSAVDRTLGGDSSSNARDFAQALRAYEAARDELGVYQKGHAELGIPSYPDYIIDVRNLEIKIANMKVSLGSLVAGPDSRRYLQEAIKGSRELVAKIPKASDPRGWARAHQSLGSALMHMGDRQSGDAAIENLKGAVEAQRAALEVFSRGATSGSWAWGQLGLGRALQSLGRRQSGEEGMRALEGAVAAQRNALAVFTRDATPQEWASTQGHLGNALIGLSARQSGEESARSLEAAASAYRSALEIFTRDATPQDWAWAQNGLGIALANWSVKELSDVSMRNLAAAVAAHRQRPRSLSTSGSAAGLGTEQDQSRLRPSQPGVAAGGGGGHDEFVGSHRGVRQRPGGLHSRRFSVGLGLDSVEPERRANGARLWAVWQ